MNNLLNILTYHKKKYEIFQRVTTMIMDRYVSGHFNLIIISKNNLQESDK